ncbi:hypothetical protein C8R45DRAFT_1041193 [Mycena sanguinolenta]|nr:hypothetical protein C8R45DRAFT_1041193 [Mycena sanguinolenta]
MHVNASQIPTPVQASDKIISHCENYCNQMLRQRRGFPLYIPGPSEVLSDGIQIGDVGTVTAEGLFIFLFNIYVDGDNAPPRYNDQDIITIHYDPGNYVSSSLVQRFTENAPSNQFSESNFIFRCRPSEGAVLTLPHGAVLKKLMNVKPLREYARKNAERWYGYMESTRGLAVDNGSLYLITGYEKAMSWGLGSYHSTQDEDTFTACFQPIHQNDGNLEYRWSGNGLFPLQHKHYNRLALTHEKSNQTVFIHGFSISLREKMSPGMFATTIVVDGDVNDIDQLQLANSSGSNSGAQASLFSWLLGFWSGGAGSGGRQHSGSVILSDFPQHHPNIFHPGKLINEYLLHKVPQAVVAISHDDDWADILAENPNTGPKTETVSDFFKRIVEKFSISEDDGTQTAFLVHRVQPQQHHKENEETLSGGQERKALPAAARSTHTMSTSVHENTLVHYVQNNPNIVNEQDPATTITEIGRAPSRPLLFTETATTRPLDTEHEKRRLTDTGLPHLIGNSPSSYDKRSTKRKHVRFSVDDDNVRPLTPSPTFSAMSLPSSPSNPDVPLPLNMGTPCVIHPVLEFTEGAISPLIFDVTLPAENVKPSTNIPPQVLGTPATDKQLSTLVLVNPRLGRWQITVLPAEGKVVLVQDVLKAIYTSLRQQVTAADFESLSPAAQVEVTVAFERRWRRMPTPEMQKTEKSKGLKRADFLGGATEFAGLSKSPMGHDCWELMLS